MNRDGTPFFFSFFPGVDASRVYVGAWALGCFHSHIISTQTFRRALTASVDRRMEIKSAPSVAYPVLEEYGGRVPESEAWSVVAVTHHWRELPQITFLTCVCHDKTRL